MQFIDVQTSNTQVVTYHGLRFEPSIPEYDPITTMHNNSHRSPGMQSGVHVGKFDEIEKFEDREKVAKEWIEQTRD